MTNNNNNNRYNADKRPLFIKVAVATHRLERGSFHINCIMYKSFHLSNSLWHNVKREREYLCIAKLSGACLTTGVWHIYTGYSLSCIDHESCESKNLRRFSNESNKRFMNMSSNVLLSNDRHEWTLERFTLLLVYDEAQSRCCRKRMVYTKRFNG